MTENANDNASDELPDRVDETMDRIESVLADLGDEEGPDGADRATALPSSDRADLREAVESVGDAVASATFDDLLGAAGFDDHSGDLTPADLPRLMREADSETVVRLRRLLELGDLADAWDDLTDAELIERFESLAGPAADEEDASPAPDLGRLLSDVWGVDGNEDAADSADAETDATSVDETADDERTGEREAADAADEQDSDVPTDLGEALRSSLDASLDSFRDRLAETREQLEDAEAASAAAPADAEDEDSAGGDAVAENKGAAGGDAVAEDEDAAGGDAAAEGPEAAGSGAGRPRFQARSAGRLSTMPSSRSDMGGGRFSTVRGRTGGKRRE